MIEYCGIKKGRHLFCVDNTAYFSLSGDDLYDTGDLIREIIRVKFIPEKSNVEITDILKQNN